MEYKAIYTLLCERGQNQRDLLYKEKHHIIPKCLGGTNESKNLTNLTAKEHWLAHRLLCKMFPHEIKLKQALWFMSVTVNRRKYKITSRFYSILRESLHTANRALHLGKKRTDETRIKIANARSKSWMAVSPKGEQFTVFNLKSFSKANKLSQGNMVEVANGKRTHHKGWTCRAL